MKFNKQKLSWILIGFILGEIMIGLLLLSDILFPLGEALLRILKGDLSK